MSSLNTRNSKWKHEDMIQLQSPKHFSRLLYTNPVCLLVTGGNNKRLEVSNCAQTTPDHARVDRNRQKLNVMTLTWLTPVNNRGMFVFSLNKRRFSSQRICSFENFTLSVPVKGMEDVVLKIGKVSGSWCDKFDEIPGLNFECRKQNLNNTKENESVAENSFYVKGTVAHMQCKVAKVVESDDDHYLVWAIILQSYVHRDYWDGKNFILSKSQPGCDGNKMLPPYLTFLGSQRFAYVTHEG